MEFDDQAVLITGATGGIGRALAERFARGGARVALHTASRVDAAKELADSLPGARHTVIQADLTAPEATSMVVERAVETLGRLDILVNNAGVYEEHPPGSVDFDAWREAWRATLALNLRAPADLCYWAARQMVEQGDGGAIVNVSSRGAFRGEPLAPAYGASKAGLNALTQSLAQALAPHGIIVTAVAPGFVDTEMVTDILAGPRGDAIRQQSPMGRVATPEEVANTVAFLASRQAPFTTGTIVDVNGASHLRT